MGLMAGCKQGKLKPVLAGSGAYRLPMSDIHTGTLLQRTITKYYVLTCRPAGNTSLRDTLYTLPKLPEQTTTHITTSDRYSLSPAATPCVQQGLGEHCGPCHSYITTALLSPTECYTSTLTTRRTSSDELSQSGRPMASPAAQPAERVTGKANPACNGLRLISPLPPAVEACSTCSNTASRHHRPGPSHDNTEPCRLVHHCS